MSKKIRYTLEYPVRCSPIILYEFLSTSTGLQEWFADKVEDSDGKFSFMWNGSVEEAEVVESEENKSIRFHWINFSGNFEEILFKDLIPIPFINLRGFYKVSRIKIMLPFLIIYANEK